MSESYNQDYVGDTNPGDSDSSASPASEPVSTDETPADNPAWSPALQGIPDVFHKPLKDNFRKWDDNYRGLESKYQQLEKDYTPYKAYEGVDPQLLGQGLNLLNTVNSDPLRVYNLLVEHLRQSGQLPGETPNPQQQLNESGLEDDPRYAELDNRTKALDQRQQQIDQILEDNQYKSTVQNYEKQVDSQVQAVLHKYGEGVVDIEDLMQRMYLQVNNGKNFDAEAAFAEQKAVFQRMYERQAASSKGAPRILAPSGNAAPSGDSNPKLMTEDQRAAYFKQLLDVANSGG